MTNTAVRMLKIRIKPNKIDKDIEIVLFLK